MRPYIGRSLPISDLLYRLFFTDKLVHRLFFTDVYLDLSYSLPIVSALSRKYHGRQLYHSNSQQATSHKLHVTCYLHHASN